MTHTPGPLKVTNERAEGNATLIAAAPDLLEALIRMIAAFDQCGLSDKQLGAVGSANQAIAKAHNFGN